MKRLLIAFVVLVAGAARAGTLTTIAGTGVYGFSGDGGPAIAATFGNLRGLAVAPDGTIYVIDDGNHRIRRIETSGIVDTVAGNDDVVPLGGDTGDGGLAIDASFGTLISIALDDSRNRLFVADGDVNRVRVVDLTTGIIDNYAGRGVFDGGSGFGGDGGPAELASFLLPFFIATNLAGDLFISDVGNCRVRRVDAETQIITTYAGDGNCASAGDGGPATSASLSPTVLAADGAGDLFVRDDQQAVAIRRIDAAGIMTTFVDAATLGALDEFPYGMADDRRGGLFIGAMAHILHVDIATGDLEIFAGSGSTSGTLMSDDGVTELEAELFVIEGVAVLPDGAMIFSEVVRIRTFGGGAGAVCGDRLLDVGEECDDANTSSGDGCSNTCDVEGGYVCRRIKTAPGPHRGVFNAAVFSSTSTTEIILCEALIDALTFWAHGFRNVTSSYGVEGLTDELFAKLCSVKRVLVAYDHDDAGNRAAAEHGERLRDAGVDVLRVVFPKGMDANEYAKKLTPADKSLRLVLDQAVPLAPRAVVVDVAQQAAKKEAPSPTPPAAPPSLAAVSVAGGDVSIALGDRTWRARGVEKNLTRSALRTTLFVHRGEQIFVDALDLYSAKSRASFLREASRELVLDESALKKDLAKVMMALEDDVERRLLAVTAPKAAHTMSADDEAEARLLLEDPHLLDHVLSDLEKCGVVGEETNKLVAYLAMTSRKLDDPLAVVIQSSSAAGKSSLLDAVLAFCPDEDLSKYSAMTGQSLYYMSGTSLAHKVLAVVEEQGAERASYALKLLQSEGELIIASTGKDESTGKLVTHEYKVEGPVAMMLTTTALDVDEELLNRVVLSVDEEREQTRAIHESQRKRRTLAGVVARVRKDEIVRLHQNAQRLLWPVHVVNPYAERLTFRDDKTRTRRDFPKYLGLIDAVALLHQHQRPKKTTTVNGSPVDYIEVMLDDVARANAIAAAVLGRSLDELQPQTRVVLGKLKAYVDGRAAKDGVDASAVRFSQRDARDALALSDTPLRKHMQRLCELELVVMHRVGARAVYELCWRGEGDGGARFLAGVADVDALRTPAAHSPPAAAHSPLTPPSLPLRSPFARGGRPPVVDEESQNGVDLALQAPHAEPSYKAKANGHATAR